jgi:membrane protein DedA with SNARE-associated domain
MAAAAFILIPFFLLEDRVVAAALSAMEAARGHPLLAGGMIVALLAGDIVLPVPSSLVSTLAGAALGFWGGVLAIWLGMSAGCLLGYGLGRRAGRRVMIRIVGEHELERARTLLAGSGGVALVLTRAVPVLAETMVLGAGAAKMPLAPFLILTSAANLAVALAYAAIGALALSTGSFFLFFFGLAALPGIGWLLWTRLGQ